MVLIAILLATEYTSQIYKFLQAETPSLRKEALIALKTIKPKNPDLKIIKERLNDTDFDVVIESAKLLYEYNDTSGINRLKQILSENSTPKPGTSPIERIKYIRVSSARKKIALYFGEIKLVNELEKYKDDSDGIVRDAVRAALAKNGNSTFKQEFIEALKSESDSKRLTAVEMLLYIGETAPLLRLKKDPVEMIRKNILDAFKEDINLQVEHLNDISSIVKETALKNILENASIEQLKKLKETLKNLLSEIDAPVKIYSAAILVKMGDEGALNVIIDAAKNEDPDIRKYTALTLKFLGKSKEKVFEILKNDENPSVKILAISNYSAGQ